MKSNTVISSRMLEKLANTLEGELRYDHISKIIYSTDASAYRETPLAVAFPKSNEDIRKLIAFSSEHKTSLIPRGAGTSLAGQVVGHGIVVDISKYMNQVLECNPEEKWIEVQPGVILEEMNIYLKQFGLMFGPETSTANRCTMGGMLGNNSCGLHSLVYGSVRDHVVEVKALLSNGSEVIFNELSIDEFKDKLKGNTLENKLYKKIDSILADESIRSEIQMQYPHPSVPRRNNGYALDVLSNMNPYNGEGGKFNFSKFIAGSEGTLAFITSIKLNLVPLPPKEKAVLCVHFDKLEDAFKANLIALKYKPWAVELMDRTIMEMTKGIHGLAKNRFFIKGDPEAILIIELCSEEKDEISNCSALIEKEMRDNGFGNHFPLIRGSDIQKVWGLRTAGLGVLSNIPGDAKPVSLVEDTAIPVDKLPEYLEEFKSLLDKYNLNAVYHAHIATGELHLRPVLNLKDTEDVKLFRIIAVETAKLVKKYRGSLSGEHGDGRLRGEFIPYMLGDKVYGLLKEIKNSWDPDNIFNPGKIINTPPMDKSLRYEPGVDTLSLNSYFDYKMEQGMARAIEKCNGSADCRKSEIIGGTMCPSFMATRDEIHSTRGRANVLRELITKKGDVHWADQHEVMESLDLCLSCKACKSECPSGVDMAKLKADFLQNHYDANPTPVRSLLIANFPRYMELAMKLQPLTGWAFRSKLISPLIKYFAGFNTKRPMPSISKYSLNSWYKKHDNSSKAPKGKVYLFNDEFVNNNESHIGVKAILLLEKLGYEVVIPQHTYSGRTYLSKGLVKKAAVLADKNVEMMKDIISEETPLIGIEPSAILSFRDEYPQLVKKELKVKALELSKNALMFDEFIMREAEKGNITSDMFTTEVAEIKLHGHCHQKALATTDSSKKMLELPVNYKVSEIPSGCCGMAGAFGYEKEHYDISIKIGELVLFPAIRETADNVIIAAPGTSCREQIEHGTGRKAMHPVEVLYGAMK